MTTNKRFTKIKDNVWKMESGDAYYSVKKYSSHAQSTKVRRVHQLLMEQNFPHIVPVMEERDPLMIVQPWLEGAKPVNFKKRVDRIDSFHALQALHATKEQIDWQAQSFLHTFQLHEKWEVRLGRFQELRERFEQYLSASVLDDIEMISRNALQVIKKQKRATLPYTLLHGDVVHHNILRDASGQIRFIDFDLACLGEEENELILWMHRVLPQINYNIHFLVGEHPELQTLSNQSLAKLLYPNEVLREWIHLLSLPGDQQQRMVSKLHQFTDAALSHWPRLWYDVERMMN